MLLLTASSMGESFGRLIDSLIPVVSSVVWIVAIRLINKWLPTNGKKDVEASEDKPDMPME